MNETETETGEVERQGHWIGEVEGLRLRSPGPDAEGPILEIHGDDGLAAMEFVDEGLVEGLTHAAAEVQMIFDETESGQ